jgi:hypothetical protein
MDLEEEIEEATKDLKKKEVRIQSNVSELDLKISFFTKLSWAFVWTGCIVTVAGVLLFLFMNTEKGFGLSLLGDFMAGTVASIWSLAGLFFIYVAFLGQKQQLLNQQLEITYSQVEVKYTRLELKGQKEEMQAQNETLRQQKFENTFFQLLTLFTSIVNSLDLRSIRTKEVSTVGRDCFNIFYTRFKVHLSEKIHGKGNYSGNLSKATIENAIQAYDTLYLNERSDLSHYFRTFYHIIKFVDKSEIENKKQYVSIARAQLSSFEQMLLFYNCLHSNGVEKFKPLIEKYALFKNIDESLIVNEKHLECYKRGAYGKKTIANKH